MGRDVVSHWIDGKPWDGAPERVADVFDPATGEVTRQVALAGRAEIDAAVSGAVGAAQEWSQTSLGRRVATLFAFRELLEARKAELARIISAEHGKVVSDALGEIARGQEVVEFACGIPHLLKGGYSESVSTGTDVHSVRQPLGVVAGITPFNFPAMVPMWMYPVAIACGNAFVLKPSERDPSASNWIAALWTEAGLPPGVFTVLHGDKAAVDGVLAHPDVRAVSFVGSTPIARYVYETAAANGKRVQALGGAKNHMVVLPDADLDAAADAAVSAGYGSAGERCMAISVVVAVGRIGDDLVDAIASRSRDVTGGAGDDAGAEMGPLVTEAHRDRVRGAVDARVAAGATHVVDGRDQAERPGIVHGPSLLDHLTPAM
jgi:malonate-semialdehyde dehydrogenase (acetylating)/methylmalonate-semialdehyde dehydrogenase